MKVLVSGQHMNVGESFQTHIEASLDKKVKKYFENAIQATVNIIKQKQHLFKAEIMVNEGTGNRVLIRSESEASDPHDCFEEALTKIEKQLRRYKERIKNHHKNKEQRAIEGKKYTISYFSEEDTHAEMPVIIAEKPTVIEKLTVSEAVMKMDLLDVPALLFVNSGNLRLNIVYYRKDGNIAWVDSSIG